MMAIFSKKSRDNRDFFFETSWRGRQLSLRLSGLFRFTFILSSFQFTISALPSASREPAIFA